ncbi:hypothetical protein GS500_06755 [Rhodococcus hoagii]|nr:hypothetical protein [Prescottella equi]NKS82875.1 hypothetical protein [Prescottella equi]
MSNQLTLRPDSPASSARARGSAAPPNDSTVTYRPPSTGPPVSTSQRGALVVSMHTLIAGR